METIDIAVVGAGVTGLAAARALAASGHTVCVLERHPRPGLDTSTHNSGVMHAGLYYPADSLKARLCVEGRRLMYAFCAEHRVPHKRCGKIVVANTDTERTVLDRLMAQGQQNGVEDLEMVDAAFIAAREPNVDAVAGLYSPHSGIVDAEAYVKALLRTGQDEGVMFLPGTKLQSATPDPRGIVLHTERETILAGQVVNAAGLYADEVSAMLGGETFTIYPCRGEYVELTASKRALVNALVYPVPDPGGHGLGVHVVKTMDGAVWLGPTIRYQGRKDDYEDGRLPVEAFVEPTKKVLRGIALGDLRLSGSGIRAKLQSPNAPFADFMIRRDRNNPAVIQAAGIESPGLTASLAIGNLIATVAATH